MTREFESEVPIRCTLFLDASAAVRLGPVGATALARLVEIAAAVAQAAAAERDLTGLCLFDETGVSPAPAPRPRHAPRSAAARPAHRGGLPLARLSARRPGRTCCPMATAWPRTSIPTCCRADVNALPWWLPLWSPQPACTVPRRPLRRGPGGPSRGSGRGAVTALGSRSATGAARGFAGAPSPLSLRKQLGGVLSVRYRPRSRRPGLLLEDDAACAPVPAALPGRAPGRLSASALRRRGALPVPRRRQKSKCWPGPCWRR